MRLAPPAASVTDTVLPAAKAVAPRRSAVADGAATASQTFHLEILPRLNLSPRLRGIPDQDMGSNEVRVIELSVRDVDGNASATDEDGDAIDDPRCRQPRACERADLGVTARALIRLAGMPDEHLGTVKVEDDVHDRTALVVKALTLLEAEDLADPISCAAGVLVREHRDHALLGHAHASLRTSSPCAGPARRRAWSPTCWLPTRFSR